MKKVEIKNAIGLPLLHDITQITSNFKGARFKKGHIIKKEDIDVLLSIGKKYIYVFEENDDLLHEEESAIRLSKITKCNNTYFSDISEGKIVQYSKIKGFLEIDLQLLNELNSIEDITICTQRNHIRVEVNSRIASMRIIPLYTNKKNIEKAELVSKGRQLLKIHNYKHKKVGLVITGNEVYSGLIQDRFKPVLQKKLSYFPSEIDSETICKDDIKMIINACDFAISRGAKLLLLTGGMSVDADDVTVSAVRELGFDIVTYGVPSQPGNMTLLAYRDDVVVIGIPSAAISRPVTVLDVILPPIFADIKMTKQNFIDMANGGLCDFCDKDERGCHFPNCNFGAF